MKATHVRPLLAFWVLASVAAFITSSGLSAPSAPPELANGSSTSATTPSPSSSPDGPERARPTAILTDILSPDMWRSAVAAEHAARLVGLAVPTASVPTTGTTVSPPTPSTTGGSGGSGGSSHQSGGSGGGTVAVRPTTTPTSPSNGHGKGLGNGHGSGGGGTHPGKGHGR